MHIVYIHESINCLTLYYFSFPFSLHVTGGRDYSFESWTSEKKWGAWEICKIFLQDASSLSKLDKNYIFVFPTLFSSSYRQFISGKCALYYLFLTVWFVHSKSRFHGYVQKNHGCTMFFIDIKVGTECSHHGRRSW